MEKYEYVVVYDPAAGFVTGGGWFISQPGAYSPDSSKIGKAHFGFVSKYQKGKIIPAGHSEFQFQAADLNFSSNSYESYSLGKSRPNLKVQVQSMVKGNTVFWFQ